MNKILLFLIPAFMLFCTLSFAESTVDAVVYVSDAGSDTATGMSDAAPLKTLTAAYKTVGEGGTVVVCGPLNLTGNALRLPKNSGAVTITSVFGGVDYAKQGAVLNLGGYTYLGGDTVFENIRINDSSSFYFNQLICGGHNLTIGNGVTCTKNSGEYITILGGMYINADTMKAADVSFYDYTITVNSGTWYGVYGSNKRTSNESAMGATGNVSIIINGGSFTGKTANQADAMIAVGGFASQDGDYYLEINGGSFNCPIYGIARPGNNSSRYTAYYEGDVRIVIRGGELHGATVSTVQSEAASYIGGNYALEIAGADFTALTSIKAPRVRGTATCKVEDKYAQKVVAADFDSTDSAALPAKAQMPDVKAADGVVFAGGQTAGDGSSSKKAFDSLKNAVRALGKSGGTVVICGPLRMGDTVLPKTEGKVTITSVFGGEDFRKYGAEIELAGILTLGGETLFEHIAMESRSLTASIFCNGNKVVFGDDIDGKRNLDGGVTAYIGIYTGYRLQPSTDRAAGTAPADITVKSGAWEFLRAGNDRVSGGSATLRSTTGESRITISGGSFHADVCGTGKNNHDGNITLDISGGSFYGSIYGMATPANIDKDVNTVNGNITLNISGGSFHGDILLAQNTAKNEFNGTYTLNITGGDLRTVSDIRGNENVPGKSSAVLNTTVDLAATVSGSAEFRNPIIGYGADPSVCYADGWYYYVRASVIGSTPCILISRAANPADIGCTTAYVVWTASAGVKSIWAPQLYRFNGVWYLYASVAGSTSASIKRKPIVLKSTDAVPNGEFTYIGELEGLDESFWSWLSPRIFEYAGARYYISSVFATEADNTAKRHKQTLVIGKLKSPTAFENGVSAIAVPNKAWEGYDIIEGPYPVYGEDGALYIAYAANYADGDDYCTGLLKLTDKTNLLAAASWEKQAEPMQRRDDKNEIFAPGATIFVPSPDGKEIYAVYHAKLHANNRYNRSIFIQKLGYRDGVPYLGAPPAIDTVMTYALNPMPVSARISGFTESKSGLSATRTYADNFKDVTADKWFAPYVKTAYEYTLANGTSATTFSPDGKFTVAQALTAAANIHKAYFGGSIDTSVGGLWYMPYVDYCVANGIIRARQFSDMNALISRGDMAIVFANILPDAEYTATRSGQVPDVADSLGCYAAVMKLYNAGIVGGDAGTGKYRPEDSISRAEACVIFTRIAAPEYRQK